jgi:hypothetical protein
VYLRIRLPARPVEVRLCGSTSASATAFQPSYRLPPADKRTQGRTAARNRLVG